MPAIVEGQVNQLRATRSVPDYTESAPWSHKGRRIRLIRVDEMQNKRLTISSISRVPTIVLVLHLVCEFFLHIYLA
jgi:hypothetical protein